MSKRSRRRGGPRKPVYPPERRIAVVQTELIHFSGPIPSPAMLREYSTIIENGAERVFRTAEGQGKHRMEMEKMVIQGGLRQQSRGLIIATIWSFSLGFGGWLLAHEGRSLVGIAIIIAALTPAGAFVHGRKSQTEERLRKLLELERAARPKAQQDLPLD